DLLGAPLRPVDAGRAHRPLHREAARFGEAGQGRVHGSEECDGIGVTDGCRGVPGVSGICCAEASTTIAHGASGKRSVPESTRVGHPPAGSRAGGGGLCAGADRRREGYPAATTSAAARSPALAAPSMKLGSAEVSAPA